jgi:LEA14-like dessication related protein
VLQVEIVTLSFEGVSLRADVELSNPNPIGIELAGYDYELAVEGHPLVSGTVEQRTAVAARGRSVIAVPATLRFAALSRSGASIGEGRSGEDELPYRISAGLAFDLPVLGRIRVPVGTEGRLPLVRPPAVRLASLRVVALSLSGASLLLGLEVENPNGFGLSLEGMSYSFAGDGQRWASGALVRPLALAPRTGGQLDVDMQLGFASLGRTVYQRLAAGGALRYDLTGVLEVGTTLALLPRASIPVQLAGEIRLTR